MYSFLLTYFCFFHQSKAFPCYDCEKRFITNAKLNEHKKNVHAPVEDKTCVYCGKEYGSIVLKKRHEANNCSMVSFPSSFFLFSILKIKLIKHIKLITNHSKARQKLVPARLPVDTTINPVSKRHQYDKTKLTAANLDGYLNDFSKWLGSIDSSVLANRVGVLSTNSVYSYVSNVRRFFVWLNVRSSFTCVFDLLINYSIISSLF